MDIPAKAHELIPANNIPQNSKNINDGISTNNTKIENNNNLEYNTNKLEDSYENERNERQTTTREQGQSKINAGRNGVSTQIGVESPLGENVSDKAKKARIFKQFEKEANKNALKSFQK